MIGEELEGKVALVTGGSRGIGLAIARELAQAGASIAVLARDGARAEEAARSLAGAPGGRGGSGGTGGTGGRHKGYACDVADPKAVAAVVEHVEKDLGPIDILVNNAGTTHDDLVVRMSDEEWDEVMNTNLRGTFNMIRAVLRGMIRRRSGRIVNITSVVALTGNAGQANYAASKAGLVGLTKSVAQEVASRGILVNAVAPGFIETDLTKDLPEPARKRLAERILLGRLGKPEDVSPVVRFLVGPRGSYITGQVIVVDGGATL